MQQRPDGVHLAAAESRPELEGEVAHRRERLGRTALDDRGALVPQDIGGRTLPAGVEQHERPVQALERLRRAHDRLHAHPAVALDELDEVEAPDGDRALVLATDRLAQGLDLDLRGLFGDLGRRAVHALVGVERHEQPDRHRARRPETGAARRDVRERQDVQAPGQAGDPERFANELVAHSRGRFDDLRLRVADAHIALEPGATTTWRYLSIVVETTAPPCSSANSSRSEPPPTKLMRSGVREMIIRRGVWRPTGGARPPGTTGRRRSGPGRHGSRSPAWRAARVEQDRRRAGRAPGGHVGHGVANHRGLREVDLRMFARRL